MTDMTLSEKLEFMKKFAETRQSQPNDGNRSPIFWLIQNQTAENCNESEATSSVFHISGANIEHSYWEDKELDDLKQDIISDITNNYDFDNGNSVEKEELQAILHDVENAESVSDIYYSIIDNPFGAQAMEYEVELTHTKEVYHTVYDHLFLTREDAKDHIEKCNYRYTNPRTYANTCLDSKYMEQLFAIIDDPDFWSTLQASLESKT